MSGFEIAGVVLGAFPLLIQGLEASRQSARTVRALRDIDREVGKRVRNLRIEEDKFEDSRNRLLSVYAEMNNPLPSFIEDTLDDLRKLQCKMMNDLNLPPDTSSTPGPSATGWTRKDIKKRILFVVKKDGLDEELLEMRRLNNDLSSYISRQGFSAPQKPTSTAAAKHYLQIRDQAIGVYQALEDKLVAMPTRTCLVAHHVGLQLEARCVPLGTHYGRRDKQHQTRFRVIIAHANPGTTIDQWNELEIVPVENGEENNESAQTNAIQNYSQAEVVNRHTSDATASSIVAESKAGRPSVGFRAKIQGRFRRPISTLSPSNCCFIESGEPRDCASQGCSRRSHSPARAPSPVPSTGQIQQGIKFFQITSRPNMPTTRYPVPLSTNCTPTLASTNSAPNAPTSIFPRVEDSSLTVNDVIYDLCRTLNTCPSPPERCIGTLISKNGKHRIWAKCRALKVMPVQQESASLHSILQNWAQWNLTMRDRLILAVQLASAVMQLHATSWLRQRWSGSDILFPIPTNEADTTALRSPVITRVLDGCPPEDAHQLGSKIDLLVQDKTLYSLGVVLLELHWGKRLAEIGNGISYAQGDAEVLELLHATEHSHKLAQMAGEKYANAVRRCIRGFDVDSHLASLEKEEYKNMVQAQIVGELEEHLRQFTGVKDLAEIFRGKA